MKRQDVLTLMFFGLFILSGVVSCVQGDQIHALEKKIAALEEETPSEQPTGPRVK